MAASFKTLMVEFAKHIGYEADDAWESPLEITIDDVVITFDEYGRAGVDELLLFADLGKVEESKELETYRALLDANLLWSGTADATIGVNSDTRHVIIAYRIPMESLDGESLALMASYFVAVVAVWKAYIEGDQLEEPDFISDAGSADNASPNVIRV